MSHITVDMDGNSPLSTYNSLIDGHLTGYFSSPKKRKHLRKIGLISRSGHLISENTYRLNMARKEHKRHIKSTLAQAIVEKTLEMERYRQNVIKQKLEEIAKLELVQRVREEELDRPITKLSSRPNSGVSCQSRKSLSPSRSHWANEKHRRELDLLPLLSPRSSQRPISGPANSKPNENPKGKFRPISAPTHIRPESGSTKASTNYDDDDDEDVEYLDENGRPIRNGDVSYREDKVLDFSQLYTLNTAALRKYAMTLARLEQGREGSSPYVTTQVPMPPKSPRISNNSARSRRYNGTGGNSDRSPTRRTANGQVYLHHTESVTTHPGQLQSMVEITMKYHGWTLSLARDEIDPRNQVVVEQQHCGGNTLTVFKDKLLPKSDFTFTSHRHRGFPFSLTIYVDGRMDSRISTCCEYRHSKNVRLGGANGHFSIVHVKGNGPCYKCQMERGGKMKKKKKKVKPEDGTEVVTVIETYQVPENISTEKNGAKESDSESEDTGNYDDDFEDSDAEGHDSQRKTESKDATQKVDNEDIDNREIRGIALESPWGSGSRSPVTEVEKETDNVQDNDRKIDAYSSEDEDLQGARNKVVVVIDKHDTALRKGQSQRNSIPDRPSDKKKIRTSKSVPVKPQKGGRSPHDELRKSKTKKVPVSDSESDSTGSSRSTTPSPRRQEILTPEPSDSSKTPEVSPKTQFETRKNGRSQTPDNQGDGSKSSSNRSSPLKTHTVWSEEDSEKHSKVSRKSSPDQDAWNNKREKIAENIVDKFDQNGDDRRYEADDEGTERSIKNQCVAKEIMKHFGEDQNDRKKVHIAEEIIHKFGRDEQKTNKHVAEVIVQTFGKDFEDEQKSKDLRIVEEILKQHGSADEDRHQENKNKRVAEEVTKQFGKHMDSQDERGRDAAEQILQQFGGSMDEKPENKYCRQKHNDTETKNNRVAEEIVKQYGDKETELDAEKKQQIAEEMVKFFGKDSVQTQEIEENEEIIKQLGKETMSNKHRLVEEIDRLHEINVNNDSDQGSSEKEADESHQRRSDEEINNLNRETPESEPVEKDSTVSVFKSLPDDHSCLQVRERANTNNSDISNSESLNSTEREILAKKRDSEQFFKHALKKKQTSLSSSESEHSSGSDSDSISGSSSDSDSDSESHNEGPPTSVTKRPAQDQQESENGAQKTTGSSSLSTSTQSPSLTPLTSNTSETVQSSIQELLVIDKAEALQLSGKSQDVETSEQLEKSAEPEKSPVTKNAETIRKQTDSGTDDSSSDSDSDSESESDSSYSSSSDEKLEEAENFSNIHKGSKVTAEKDPKDNL